MSVLIVSVNYGTAPMTLQAADAGVAAALHLGCDWSYCIVDNKSPDDSVAVLRAGMEGRRREQRPGWERVHLLESDHNGGFGAGNNLAIRQAFAGPSPPEYVYLLNSDAFPEAGAIAALKQHLDAHPEAGVAGSLTRGTDDRPHTTAFRFPSILSEFEDSMRLGVVSRLLARWRVPVEGLTQTAIVDWVAGASMMLRASALRQVGLFDENFFLYFEETELCLRIRRAGWMTVFVADSRVRHIGGATTGVGRSNGRPVPGYWLDSRYYYFWKSHGYAYLLLATAVRVLGLSLWHLRRVIQRKEDSQPPGLLGALVRHFCGKDNRHFGALRPEAQTS